MQTQPRLGRSHLRGSEPQLGLRVVEPRIGCGATRVELSDALRLALLLLEASPRLLQPGLGVFELELPPLAVDLEDDVSRLDRGALFHQNRGHATVHFGCDARLVHREQLTGDQDAIHDPVRLDRRDRDRRS
jgi:hypothetical protein